MQRLYKTGFPEEKHIPALKKLWADVFGDGELVINKFFENTQSAENTACVFCDDEPVSMLYAIDAVISYGGKKYNSYYVYAVCTANEHRGKGLMSLAFRYLEDLAVSRGVSYLFLVPEEPELFAMYEKLGFKTAFSYKETEYLSVCVNGNSGKFDELFYENYVKLREGSSVEPLATLQEKGFNSFLKPATEDVKILFDENAGYAVAECVGDTIIVHELFGDKQRVLKLIFESLSANKVVLREPATESGVPSGMLKALDGSPYFENGFFGVAYGG